MMDRTERVFCSYAVSGTNTHKLLHKPHFLLSVLPLFGVSSVLAQGPSGTWLALLALPSALLHTPLPPVTHRFETVGNQ